MCAIIGAPTAELFKQLYDYNSYRGKVSYSVARFLFDQDGLADLIFLSQMPGELNVQDIKEYSQPVQGNRISYWIGHTQAPTGTHSRIHPAEYKGARLWHNGIVKADKTQGWDTEEILRGVVDHGFSTLSEVDGTFACVLHMDRRVYIFRNEIAPLFDDEDDYATSPCISSTKWDDEGVNSTIRANTVWALEPDRSFPNVLTKRYVSSFKTKENPYYF